MKCAFLLAAMLAFAPASFAQSVADGSKAHPLRVMLIPADGGTETGTKADYQPVFNAVSRMTGLNFDLKVGQSYGAVVEAMCNQLADVAFFGPVAYVQANRRGCAQLLAVGVENGQSVYYAGMFAKADAPIQAVKDVKGRRMAFGDVNSASSFTFQIAMLMDAGLDPVKDLSAIRMTGSHANSLAALVQGQVDVAALSFDSYEKAVKQGAVDPRTVKVVAKSMPIPYPPLALNAKLPDALKARLKEAFATVHKAPGVTPDMIRGYGGKKVDAFDTRFSEAEFNVAAEKLALLSDELKGEILKKASER
ncbi:phosphate/phosphite/phosphonate ABC transporter substrate-binding protein [Pigmentiphaga sp.]|uniref:phosphate/phosphite/phosphonate ABC transporter substrate-binding protein n=1 Tax=Pigmentiphaga sp. TaxID=1977564 RepID=UPI0025E099C5|nr:phosphate/phosphite/phosphonate ABC transporter substrate-binding protein [Pigmentiphaga sp.]